MAMSEKTGSVERRLRKGVDVVPSLFTTGNIFCGFYSVMESLAGAQSISLDDIATARDHFDRAAINIGLAALFDMLDGRIARMTRTTSEFGLELDSLADILSFGIAPALLAYAWGYGQAPQLHKVAWIVSFLFVICGALRLARFNVQARQTKLSLPAKTEKKAFVGMPIPMGASMIAAVVHFSPKPLFASFFSFSVIGWSFAVDGYTFSIALLVLVACLAFLMISTIRYSSFKEIGARTYHPRVLIIGLALIVLLIWFYSRWTLLTLATVYVSHGPFFKLWAMLRPRLSVTRPRRNRTGLEQVKLHLDQEPHS
jgi:CDP-diacylglycerol--serine O-phosphatidyltransferase